MHHPPPTGFLFSATSRHGASACGAIPQPDAVRDPSAGTPGLAVFFRACLTAGLLIAGTGAEAAVDCDGLENR